MHLLLCLFFLTALTTAAPILPRASVPPSSTLQPITTSLQQTSTVLNTNSDIVSQATRHLSYDATANLDPTTDLTNAINQVAHALWGTAYEVEKHTSAISGAGVREKRDVAAKDNPVDALKAAVSGKTRAVKKLEDGLKGAVDGIKHVAMAFSSSDKKAVEDAIKASAKAADAAIKSIGKLGDSVKGVKPVVGELEGVLKGFVGFANGVKLPDW